MKNSVAAVVGVILLAVGYVAGVLIQIPSVEPGLLSGNVKKANVYNKVVSPEVKAEMEQLASDTLTQKSTMFMSALMLTRAMQMDELVNNTLKATEGKEGMEAIHTYMQDMSGRTQNAISAMKSYVDEADKVIKGEKSRDYEQAKSNASNAFMALDRDVKTAPELVDAMTGYLAKEDEKSIAEAAAQWMLYAGENATLFGNKMEKSYWNNEINEVLSAKSDESLASALRIELAFMSEAFAELPMLGINMPPIDDGFLLHDSLNLGASLVIYHWGELSHLSNALGSINPSDIEDIVVLKDGSATAIYGDSSVAGGLTGGVPGMIIVPGQTGPGTPRPNFSH